jgi:hypothetical protein
LWWAEREGVSEKERNWMVRHAIEGFEIEVGVRCRVGEMRLMVRRCVRAIDMAVGI